MAGMDIAPIVRTQDYSIIKQNEDNKGLVDQANIAQTVQKQDSQKSQEVNDPSRSDWYQKKQDASEGGSNSYAGDGGRNRKREEKPKDRVVVKSAPRGFDIKI